MTPEGKVKKQCVTTLKQLGAYYFFPSATQFGRSGIPDIIGCYHGKFFAIECKAGKNTTTALQDKEIEKIQAAGGLALVVNEENLGELKYLILDEFK
jgi:Holliday junction resolvase